MGVFFVKKTLPWALATAGVMLALPYLAVTFVKGDGGMAACFALFFAVDPVCSILAGLHAGRDVRAMWMLAILPAALFLAGAWLVFDMGEPAFVRYAAVYLLLGTGAMALRAFAQKRAAR